MALLDKKGRVQIQHQILRKNLEVARLIFDKIYVLRAESLFTEDVILYDCLCEDFRELKIGDKIPDYNILIDFNKDLDTFTVRFVDKY